MNIIKRFSLVTIFFMLIVPILSLSAESDTKYINSFDENKIGQLPTGWIVGATLSSSWFSSSSKTEQLATWKIQKSSDKPAGNTILSITQLNHSSTSTFNLIRTDKIKFKNGELSVKVRANSGSVDQGGGPIWRVKDYNNYYVARYNPLEGNFRIYYVKEGSRMQIKSAGNISIKQGEWFEIKIKHINDHIEGWLNGKKLLDVIDDTLKNSGGVGLWTKADALTSFDDFYSSAK